MRDTFYGGERGRDARKIAREALKSRVAELMSQGLSTVKIRTRMGMSNGAIQRVIVEIRNDLGWQAV